MAEIKVTRVEQGQTKIRNVPIAVTPEGFWCCPAPVVFQKTTKTQNPSNKTKPPSPPPLPPKAAVPKKPPSSGEKKPPQSPIRPPVASDDQPNNGLNTPSLSASRQKVEGLPRKVGIEFGEPGTSNLKVVLLGKQGFRVKLSVHKDVLVENSGYFADKLSGEKRSLSYLEIDGCGDVEIYVETFGLMYCNDIKQRLIKQSVSRVLRIIKVAEFLRFNMCIQSCLEYLEAVPWVGEEEEEKVVSSVLELQSNNVQVTPILQRVSSEVSDLPKDTLSQVMELVLKSTDERARREMKSVVLKLLKENNTSNSSGITDVPIEMVYTSCRSCLNSLLSSFKDPECASKQIALEADNLLWLLELLASRQSADEFAIMWANQQELAALHPKLPVATRCHASSITARLLVGIGRGELLPSKDTRCLLLERWLEPLISDYRWLESSSRSFDRAVVEEGIGRTILTLPLENQRSILMDWLGIFLKSGDNCPNLQRAFEVWWRRTFVRQVSGFETESLLPKMS